MIEPFLSLFLFFIGPLAILAWILWHHENS